MPLNKTQLVKGLIPANTVCPFADGCPSMRAKTCAHTGATHPVSFSCGYARLFDLMGMPKEWRKE